LTCKLKEKVFLSIPSLLYFPGEAAASPAIKSSAMSISLFGKKVLYGKVLQTPGARN
jgi:hypothetical protein